MSTPQPGDRVKWYDDEGGWRYGEFICVHRARRSGAKGPRDVVKVRSIFTPNLHLPHIEPQPGRAAIDRLTVYSAKSDRKDRT